LCSKILKRKFRSFILENRRFSKRTKQSFLGRGGLSSRRAPPKGPPFAKRGGDWTAGLSFFFFPKKKKEALLIGKGPNQNQIDCYEKPSTVYSTSSAVAAQAALAQLALLPTFFSESKAVGLRKKLCFVLFFFGKNKTDKTEFFWKDLLPPLLSNKIIRNHRFLMIGTGARRPLVSSRGSFVGGASGPPAPRKSRASAIYDC
jgi:hypothetical protein